MGDGCLMVGVKIGVDKRNEKTRNKPILEHHTRENVDKIHTGIQAL